MVIIGHNVRQSIRPNGPLSGHRNGTDFFDDPLRKSHDWQMALVFMQQIKASRLQPNIVTRLNQGLLERQGHQQHLAQKVFAPEMWDVRTAIFDVNTLSSRYQSWKTCEKSAWFTLWVQFEF